VCGSTTRRPCARTRSPRPSAWPTGSATGPELSGGQQQRVAIARALITSPDLLFADEPTGNLDSTTSAEVLEHLRRSVRELGQTVVMVTHDRDAASYADDVITMQDGRIA
jgi:putative ABC transport system ATP-binding protein